jgi:hypothetical protein
MPSRSTAFRLLLAAVVCVAIALGLGATHEPRTLDEHAGDREPASALTQSTASLEAPSEATTAPRPTLLRRSIVTATIVAIIGLFVARLERRPVVFPGPARRPVFARGMRSRRAPPLALPR